MTYQDLLNKLKTLTPDQLSMEVVILAEDDIRPEDLFINKAGTKDRLPIGYYEGQPYFVATVC